jgi:hypothetical protein
MSPKVLHIRSLTPGASPTTASLEVGQIAINVPDSLVYIRQSGSGVDTVNPLLSANVKNTGNFILSGSSSITGSLAILGNTIQSGSNTLIGNTTLSGSIQMSGSITQVGDIKLLGDTTISGSLIISGAFGTPTPSLKIYGDLEQNGYIQFKPVTTNIDTSKSGSYIYVSGSTNDLYFSQNGSGYNNVTRLRWLEGSLYSGLLNGGLIVTQSATTYQVTSGSGIIVNLNGSLTDNPFPTIKYLNWPSLSASIAPLSASYDQSFIAIDSAAQIFTSGTPYYDGQYDTLIPIGIVLHQNHSTINGVKTQPSLAYGFKQRESLFSRAFGALKLSGFSLAPSGSNGTTSTGSLVVAGGTAYLDGANYTTDQNNPSYVVDAGTRVSKIFRYYQSGSGNNNWVYDTNNGNGYTTIDPTRYSKNGVLTAVSGSGVNRGWSIQRAYWYPNSITKAIVVYYGNGQYPTENDAIINITVEPFIEAPNTAANALYLGAIVVRNDAVFNDIESFKIMPGGLFRGAGGAGGGGGTLISQTLRGLTDVDIVAPTDGQVLMYHQDGLHWQNSSYISASISGNAATATSASYAVTASYLIGSSATSSYAITSSYAASASYSATSSFAGTASYVNPLHQAVIISGSLALTGSINVSGSITASLLGTASYAAQSLSSSYANSASYSVSSSFATTASYSDIAGALVSGIDINVNNVTASVVSASLIIADGSQLTNIGSIDKIFYVSEQGVDTNDGKTMNTTFRTVKRAAQAASASYAANASPAPYRMSIRISPGYYVETASIWIAPWTSIMGNDLRTTVVKPTDATKGENLFLMNNGTYAWGLRFEGCEIDDLENPRKGFFFAFAPSASITTSPYIQNCSCINTPADKFYTPLDPTANPPNPLVGNGPGGMIVDDSVLDPFSPLKSMIVDSYTQVAFNGIGLCVRGRGYAQQVSFFTNFTRVGVYAMEGGHASLLNSNTTFGDYGLRASGSRIIVVPNITNISASVDVVGSTLLTSEKTAIKNYMIAGLQTNGWYSSSYSDTGSIVYSATMKDAGLLIDALAADLLVAKAARTSTFLQGEFKGQDVSNDKRFTLPAATGFTKGAIAAFRVNDSKHMAQDYTSSYQFIKNYIINDPDNKFTTMLSQGKQKVGQMLDLAIDVIRSVAIDVEPTYLEEFGSLITSTSHDFSYAGSGVNFLGLPSNQGGVGTTNKELRVYSEAGGRVYESSGDETGNFYVGSDFVIQQSTGTIEGRTFNKSIAARVVPLNLALEG